MGASRAKANDTKVTQTVVLKHTAALPCALVLYHLLQLEPYGHVPSGLKLPAHSYHPIRLDVPSALRVSHPPIRREGISTHLPTDKRSTRVRKTAQKFSSAPEVDNPGRLSLLAPLAVHRVPSIRLAAAALLQYKCFAQWFVAYWVFFHSG